MLCYIFDVDDTLVEYVDFDMCEWYEFIALPVAEKYNIPLSFEKWEEIINGKASRRYSEGFGIDAKIFWSEVDKRNLQYRKAMLKEGRLKAYSDTDILKHLSGKKIAWSVSSEECVKFVLSTFSLLQYFDFVIGKDYENYAYLDDIKPSPKFIELIKEKMGCDKCVVIGDGDRELEAARKAGCVAILVKRRKNHSPYADFTISSLNELADKKFL